MFFAYRLVKVFGSEWKRAQWSSHLLPPRAAKFKRFIKRRAEQEKNEQQSREKRNRKFRRRSVVIFIIKSKNWAEIYSQLR